MSHTTDIDRQTITGAADAFNELLGDFLADVKDLDIADKADRNLVITYCDDLAGYLIDLGDFEDTQITAALSDGQVTA